MGINYACTLNQYESIRAQNWFPCITDTVISLDNVLLRKLEESLFDIQLSFADVTCLLRWFNSIPNGFLSKDDQNLAEKLSASLINIFS